MSKVRYVVAMIRRDPPVKPGSSGEEYLRSEFPLEDYGKFILDALDVPKKRKWWHRRLDEDLMRRALRAAIRIGVSRAYSHLMNQRWKRGRLNE